MLEVIGITPGAAKAIIHILRTRLKTDEPVDPFEIINSNRLDSSLKSPFLRPKKNSFREELIDKSATLFYLLVENHALPTNGNKRFATLSLLVMLDFNSYSLHATSDQLYELSLEVTKLTKQQTKHHLVISKIKGFLRKRIFFTYIERDKIIEKAFQYFLEGYSGF